MGLFDKLITGKGGTDYGVEYESGKVYAPMKGRYIPLEQIPDPVFSEGILGQGCGIEPEDGEVVSPVDGKILSVADTKHAVGIKTSEGAEFLIHVGMDTVEMNGKGFSVKVKKGDTVKAGQPVISFSLSDIKAAGHPTTSAFVVTNPDECKTIVFQTDSVFDYKNEVGTVAFA